MGKLGIGTAEKPQAPEMTPLRVPSRWGTDGRPPTAIRRAPVSADSKEAPFRYLAKAGTDVRLVNGCLLGGGAPGSYLQFLGSMLRSFELAGTELCFQRGKIVDPAAVSRKRCGQ